MSRVPAVELNDGNHIPQFGFGVFQIQPAALGLWTSERIFGSAWLSYRGVVVTQTN